MNDRPSIENLAILASAGSGKTYQLAHRYIRLMALGVSADKICALTFSRKAAREIFESIVNYLVEAADGSTTSSTADRIGLPGFGREAFQGLLRRFLDALNRLQIGTLDSFMIGVVRAFPSELGVTGDFQVLDADGPAARELQADALGNLIRSDRGREKDQRDFFEAFKQATLGREEKGLERGLFGFLDKCLGSYRLLPREEGWGNVDVIWPKGSPWLRAINLSESDEKNLRRILDDMEMAAPARKALDRFIEAATAYRMDSQWDEKSLSKSKIGEQIFRIGEALGSGCELSYRKKTIPLQPEAGRILREMLHNVLGTELRRSIEQTRGIYRILDAFVHRYDSTALSSGRLTFDDVQRLLTPDSPTGTVREVSRHPGEESRLYIDYRLDCSLDHWLLDEFQDTSDLQWSVLRNLVDEVIQDDSGSRSFFYVGDIKQAIYGWRGGNARLFGSILERYESGGRLQETRLDQSCRSCPEVLDAVNGVFGDLSESGLPSEAVSRWQSLWSDHAPHPEVAPREGFAQVLEPIPPAGEKQKPSEEDRHNLVAELLNEIDPVGRGLSVGVLVRRNAVAERVANVLRSRTELPVVLEGQSAVTDSSAVVLLLSLVKLAAHPGDRFAWEHLLMSPLRRITLDELGDSEQASIPLLRQLTQEGFQLFIESWWKRLTSCCELDEFNQTRLSDLCDAAGEFDGLGGNRNVNAFLDFVAAYRVREGGSGGAVRIMTIHQSKGLGFDVVVLPDLMGYAMDRTSRTDSPISRTPEGEPQWALQLPRKVVCECDPVLSRELERRNEDHAFESLCILYVAMTRAKRGLYLVTSDPGGSSETLDEAALIRNQLAVAGATQGEETTPVAFGDMNAYPLYGRGDPGWYQAVEKTPEKTPEVVPALDGYSKRPSLRSRLERVEPSGREEIVSRADRFFAREAGDILDFGSAIHRLFEGVEWLDTTDVDRLVESWRDEAGESSEVIRDVEKQFRQAIRSPQVVSAMSRPDDEVDLWREKAFECVMPGQRWVSGIFDRVVIYRRRDGKVDRAEILDFKSSLVQDEHDENRRLAGYAPQLALYGRALSLILGLELDRIRLFVVFTRAGTVREISDWQGVDT